MLPAVRHGLLMSREQYCEYLSLRTDEELASEADWVLSEVATLAQIYREKIELKDCILREMRKRGRK